MRALKYSILLLFICSIFGCVSISKPIIKDQDITKHDLWFEDCQWLMLKQEKAQWKSLKTEWEKEAFVEKFYQARDPDTFTRRNEFRITYEANLEKARKDYPDFDDSRRYICLVFGEPEARRLISDQLIVLTSPVEFGLRINKGEIWKYAVGAQNFQVIFAKINLHQLQFIKDRQITSEEDVASLSLPSSPRYEILYIGPDRYADIPAFLEDFFQENFRLRATSDTIDNLKKAILDRAADFYSQKTPKARSKKYAPQLTGISIFIHQFNLELPNESGIAIWISLDRGFLKPDSRKKEYLADISLYCEILDVHSNKIIYYKDDSSVYKLNKERNCLYRFWGSLPPGKYKLILDISENVNKKSRKIEADVEIIDFSAPILTAGFLVGKLVDDSDKRINGKPGYLPFKDKIFYPAFSGEYFRDKDELIVIFDICGFKKNLYGNPYLERALLFVRVEVDEQGRVAPTNEVYTYPLQSLESDGNRSYGSLKIKVEDLVKILKIPTGFYRVELLLEDKIANRGKGVQEYPYPILILSAEAIKNNLNILMKGTD